MLSQAEQIARRASASSGSAGSGLGADWRGASGSVGFQSSLPSAYIVSVPIPPVIVTESPLVPWSAW
jgi:hypothetical protein